MRADRQTDRLAETGEQAEERESRLSRMAELQLLNIRATGLETHPPPPQHGRRGRERRGERNMWRVRSDLTAHIQNDSN